MSIKPRDLSSKQYTNVLWMKQICMAYEHLHVLHKSPGALVQSESGYM